MKYEVAAIVLQVLVARILLDLLDLVVDREYGDFFNGLLARISQTMQAVVTQAFALVRLRSRLFRESEARCGRE